MKRRQYRVLQVAVFTLTVLFGATACGKHKAKEAQLEASAPEQTQATASGEQAVQDQQVEHPADYYKADNKQRVAEENSLLDDVPPKK